MSDITPTRKSARSELIADLFRILRVMASDEDVPEPYFRIAFRIAQYANADTGWAAVSDRTLVDVLPRTTDKKLRLFRRFMEKEIEGPKWLRTIEGERGRPTRYLFIPDRIPEIERRLEAAAEKREAEFALRKIEERTALHVAALGGQIHPDNPECESGLPGQSDPPSIGGKSVPFTGSNLPPFYLRLLPHRQATGMRMRLRTHMRSCPHPHLCLPVPILLSQANWIARNCGRNCSAGNYPDRMPARSCASIAGMKPKRRPGSNRSLTTRFAVIASRRMNCPTCSGSRGSRATPRHPGVGRDPPLSPRCPASVQTWPVAGLAVWSPLDTGRQVRGR